MITWSVWLVSCDCGFDEPLCRATQDGQVIVESSDKTWSIREKDDKKLQHSCLENPMNSMKRENVMMLKDEPEVSSCRIWYWTTVEQ